MNQVTQCQCPICSIQSLDLPTLSILQSPTEPIRTLLQNNREPHHSEMQQIGAYLEQASREFLDFSSRIKQLDLLREMLKHEQDKYQEAIWRHQGVVSIVRRVPDDILRAIFLEVVEDLDSRDRLNVKVGAWNLSHVCSRWRAVALSTALLWSTIAISHDKHIPGNLCTVVSTSLSRSGMAPLSVVFWDDPAQKTLLPVLRMLCTHSSRWQSANFVVDTAEVYECLAAIESAPALEQTILFFLDSQINAPGFQFPRFSPNLECVRVKGNRNQQVSMDRLQMFHSSAGDSKEDYDLVNLLPQLPCIEELHMKYNTIRITDAPCILPYLESLSLKCDQEIQGLRYLTLPKLIILTLQSESLLDKIPTLDIALMLENSRCPLLSLTCGSRTFDAEELHRVLLAVPTLQDFDLQLTDWELEEHLKLFEILTCREVAKIVVPELEEFKLSILNIGGRRAFECRDAYRKMVKSRVEYRGEGEFEAELDMAPYSGVV